ncbi:MAG: GMP reductase [Bacteroidetes bacterium]|nr:GMP reductase [Bacteroidota bacterium]
MRIESDIKLDYKDVLLRPKRSTLTSRKEVDLKRTFTFPNCYAIWRGVPIVAANMDTVGTFETGKALAKEHMLTCLSKHYDVGEWRHKLDGYGIWKSEESRLANEENWEYNERSPNWQNRIYNHLAVSCGIKDQDLEYLENILYNFHHIKFICIDAANGYSNRFCEFVKKVRDKYSNHIIIAGNVVTGEMTEEIILSGADIVKVGIGGGSVCTTRIQTGVGYPQLSAVIECADAAHGLGGHIMADGGCVSAGDVSKAFCAGADFVMLGGMLAGHNESAGQEEIVDGQKYKIFYGMSSDTAMNKHNGGVANYRSSEGKTVRIKHRGRITDTVENILGGVRSTCTYIGAKNLKNMPKCATFLKVSQQSNEIFGRNT